MEHRKKYGVGLKRLMKLLRLLGLTLINKKHNDISHPMFYLKMTEDDNYDVCLQTQSLDICGWEKISDLIEDLFMYGQSFVFSKKVEEKMEMKVIDNPYFGCNSYTEAMIKRDLS